MSSEIPSGDVDASFPSRERTQVHLPPNERISDIEDSNKQQHHHETMHLQIRGRNSALSGSWKSKNLQMPEGFNLLQVSLPSFRGRMKGECDRLMWRSP